MDYAKLIDRQLVKVFKKTVSLQTSVVFNLKQGEGFDFATASPTVDTTNNLPKQVLVIKTTHKQDVVRKELLMERIDDLSIYDSVQLDGECWQLGGTIVDNAHTQIVEVFHG